MGFEYRETSADLQARIDIHQQYGSRDIDAWMLQLLNLQPGSRILDVGCGSGKQCLAFYHHLNGQAEITGGDFNAELLAEARERSQAVRGAIEILELDFNRPFDLPSDHFDLVSCCFAIYYAADVEFTVGEMHRVLKPGGRLFTTGPMPENKALFYEIIRQATGKPIPPMPGSPRYNFDIRRAIETLFSSLQVEVFENPLTFETLEPFLAYTRASLSEDRKLWRPLFDSHEGFEQVMGSIAREAERRLAEHGRLVMTKVVGGFVATK
jgi:ubiquinone/menaquinone biosynthesis C-methylase UbiE